MTDPLQRIVDNELAMARTPAQLLRAETKMAHVQRAGALLAEAEAWIDCDEETMGARGYGWASFLVDLAQLHLRIRDLL